MDIYNILLRFRAEMVAQTGLVARALPGIGHTPTNRTSRSVREDVSGIDRLRKFESST
jgi:hypothetical protein